MFVVNDEYDANDVLKYIEVNNIADSPSELWFISFWIVDLNITKFLRTKNMSFFMDTTWTYIVLFKAWFCLVLNHREL